VQSKVEKFGVALSFPELEACGPIFYFSAARRFEI